MMVMMVMMITPPSRLPHTGALLLLGTLLLLPPGAVSHPQPCQVLRRIGHTVRVGALHVQPRVVSTGTEDWESERQTPGPGPASLRTRGRARSSGGGGPRQREDSGARGLEERVFAPRDSVLLAAEAVNRAGLLPYNLSLELVLAVGSGLGELPALTTTTHAASRHTQPGEADAEDPLSFVESVCHTVVVQGVAALLGFPRNRDELLQLDFLSSALRVPVVSVVRREFARDSQVSRKNNKRKKKTSWSSCSYFE